MSKDNEIRNRRAKLSTIFIVRKRFPMPIQITQHTFNKETVTHWKLNMEPSYTNKHQES